MMANGSSVERVVHALKKRGLSASDISAHWPELEQRALKLTGERRRRVRTMGLCWLVLGLLMIGGMIWSWIMYGSLPLLLLVGIIPGSYGMYLLRLPATEEPSIKPPAIFGRNL